MYTIRRVAGRNLVKEHFPYGTQFSATGSLFARKKARKDLRDNRSDGLTLPALLEVPGPISVEFRLAAEISQSIQYWKTNLAPATQTKPRLMDSPRLLGACALRWSGVHIALYGIEVRFSRLLGMLW